MSQTYLLCNRLEPQEDGKKTRMLRHLVENADYRRAITTLFFGRIPPSGGALNASMLSLECANKLSLQWRYSPSLTGEIHLPGFVDFHLQRNGDQPAYTFAYGVNEVVTITFAQLGRAVHRGAIYFKKSLGSREGETLALIASVDSLLYVTVVLAAVKAGYAPFMISPRNSPAAVTSMLTKIGCTHILRQSNSALDQILLDSIQSKTLTFHELPTLERLYGPDRLGLAHDFVPFSSHVERSPDHIGFVIHSSGSTGFPKPVPQKFLTILHWMSFLDVSGLKDPAINLCGAMGLPGFHAFGVNFQLLYPLALSKPTSLFPPTSYDFRTGEDMFSVF
ncbi:acetyl-CoA synthetase-like protein [Dendrothele bispora CBS 962.96]|uniref:Acetyl-CoA synthetase-like protein n=1 Tax=Dendrothele bispora (strain CBS 962.96) TaxID=1314807 RepID=A0A4V4HD08_DENBC|nr:acetyl-CoA synthetase-like protein [Dendrothele bispora CBS 962.96]